MNNLQGKLKSSQSSNEEVEQLERRPLSVRDRKNNVSPVENNTDWHCLICGEDIEEGKMCKCMRDYKNEPQ